MPLRDRKGVRLRSRRTLKAPQGLEIEKNIHVYIFYFLKQGCLGWGWVLYGRHAINEKASLCLFWHLAVIYVLLYPSLSFVIFTYCTLYHS